MNIYFDIETCPARPDVLKALMPDFEGRGGTKDPAKIKEQIAAKQQAFIEDAPLHAEIGQVTMIGYIKSDGKFYCDSQSKTLSEANILREFWALWKATTMGTQLVVDAKFIGHYIRGFDVPFLIRRSWILGVPVPYNVLTDRGYLNDKFVDVHATWQLGDKQESISLEMLSKVFGVRQKGKAMSGAEVPAAWLAGKHKECIDHCRDDLEITKAVHEQMQFSP